MTTLQILAEVLSNAADEKQIPSVQFKMNNDLSDEVLKLTGVVQSQSAEESNAQIINRYLAEIAGAIDEETGEAKSVEGVEFTNEVCEKISDVIASRMKDVTDKLRAIHTEVTNVSKDISDKYNKIIASDPYLAKHLNDEASVTFDYPSMRFDALEDLGGIKNTIAYVLSEAGSDQSAMQLNSKFINAMGKFTARKLTDDSINDIEVSNTLRKQVVDTVLTENSGLIEDHVDKVAKVIVNAQSLKGLRNRSLRTIESGTPTEVVIECIGTISDYRKTTKLLVDAFNKVDVDVPEGNINFINDLTDMCGVAVQYHRVNTFANTVLFKNKTLNPDTVKSIESKGLSVKDIAQHVQYRYKNYELPSTGVTIEALEQGKERIDADVAKFSSQNKVRVEAGLHDAKHNAFMQVVSEYLAQPQFKDKVAGEGSLRSYLVTCAKKYTDEGSSCEDVIYLIMEKLLYRDDFTMTLRKNLGMDYVRAVATNKNLSASDMAEINAVVYARLITDYMKTQFMEEC